MILQVVLSLLGTQLGRPADLGTGSLEGPVCALRGLRIDCQELYFMQEFHTFQTLDCRWRVSWQEQQPRAALRLGKVSSRPQPPAPQPHPLHLPLHLWNAKSKSLWDQLGFNN